MHQKIFHRFGEIEAYPCQEIITRNALFQTTNSKEVTMYQYHEIVQKLVRLIDDNPGWREKFNEVLPKKSCHIIK
jgi:hypothetical protein